MVRGALTTAGVLAVAGISVLAAVGFGGMQREPTTDREVKGPKATAAIVERTLTDTKSVPGKLAYGAALPLASKMDGTVTWLPGVGSVVRRGGQLLRVDERPIVLLFGPLPAYRDLREGLGGLDVRQLEENLWALGYRGFKVDK